MRHSIFFLIALLLITSAASAQSVRQKIDSERAGLKFSEAKSLEKARSFINRDSTYYVGYLYYGAYLFFRADDKLGYNKAIDPLKKALSLLEKDYIQKLRTRTNSYEVYTSVYPYHYDYGLIADMLQECYQNIEMPDKAFSVLQRVRDKNFQIEQGVSSYNTMGWIFYRNRVYTSKQFPFLKNSVQENVTAAKKYLDSALMKIKEDFSYNNGLFDPTYLNRQYLSTYHYLAIIYDYKLELDTATAYYNQLIQANAYSPNNFAEFQLAMGNFEVADQYFKEAERVEGSREKATKEYFYMRGTLDIYRGHPDEADTLLRAVMQVQGASPGFGWHSIGLARALHYEGLTTESQEYTDKASRFQELHIGTTWGQEQYNLAVSSLNYINELQFKKEYFFEHDEWWFWFNPVNWYEWLRFSLEIHHYKMLLASMVAENPERAQVVYSIFSSENLMCFDEVWSSMNGFGNEYFIKLYEKSLATDRRPALKKYFRYFLGKLYLEEGDKQKATEYFTDVIRATTADAEYNVLLAARAYEGLALASSGSSRTNYMMKEFDMYPQLAAFSGLEMKFKLETSGQVNSELAEKVLKELKNCNLDFVQNEQAPLATISFLEIKDGIDITYKVTSSDGYHTVSQGVLQVLKKDPDGGGRLLAYRLFNIQKKLPEEKDVKEKPAPKAV